MDELLKTLKEWSKKIRDQKEIGGNTHDLVGNLFLRYADFAEKLDDKIDNLETYKKGYFSNFQLLNDTYPNPQKGWYAYVNEHDKTSGTDTIFIWEVVSENEEWLWSKTEIEITEDLLTLHEYALKTDLDSVDQRLSSDLEQTKTSLTEGLTKKADGCKLTEDNKLQLTSEGENVGEAIELSSGIINLSAKSGTKYETKQEARSAVENSKDKTPGQLITYQLANEEWILDHFIGSDWNNENSWDNYILSSSIFSIINDINELNANITMLKDEVDLKVDSAEIVIEDEKAILQLISKGKIVTEVALPSGGGGSGGGSSSFINMRLRYVDKSNLVVSENDEAIIKFTWSSIEITDDQEIETGNGFLQISVNNIPVYNSMITQGEQIFNVTSFLNLGANTVNVRVTDQDKNSRNLNFSVQKSILNLSSVFDINKIYDNKSSVMFPYKVIGSGSKTIKFKLNGVELSSEATTTSGNQMSKELKNLKVGSNTLRVIAESNILGSIISSNELYYEFIYTDGSLRTPQITTSFNQSEIKQFSKISIPYFVYDPAIENALISLWVNDKKVNDLTVKRTTQYWDYIANETGQVTLRIQCGSTSKTINLNVVTSDLDIREELTDLTFKINSIGKTNSSNDKNEWSDRGYSSVFKNFLWSEDGWKNDRQGNTSLLLLNDANIEIGVSPFNSSVTTEGTTLTFEYATENITDETAEIISCMSNNVGISITPTSVKIKSSQSSLEARLDSSERTSISFVIEKKAEGKRLLQLYINGIISGATTYPEDDNFLQLEPQPIKVSTGNRTCHVRFYGMRWYRNNLNYNQLLGNYIYDIESLSQKEAIQKRNMILDDYGNIDYNKALNYLPCMTIVGSLPQYKDNKQKNTIIYEDKQHPEYSFIAYNAENDVQGTSSQYYPRKNYKFKLKEGVTLTQNNQEQELYSLRGGIPAHEFCVKADFAESSGTHNTGMAVIVDKLLKDMGQLTPPQKENKLVRTTIDGYPILIFHKENETGETTFIGKYNFNNDKASEDVFGFKSGDECWEFKNNFTDRSLFKISEFSALDNKGKPEWLNDFEGRYPDGHEDPTNLKKLFDWVISCKDNPAKFKAECSNHFNIEWLQFYWLITETFGMVDQRAKNQFLTTFGEKSATGDLIWYFIFYDNDTCLGINNKGNIEFNYNIETEDINKSGHVFNGWDSELWILVKNAFYEEIQQMYYNIRNKGFLSVDTIMNVLEKQQASKWAEQIYNQDGYFKYIRPLVDGYWDYSESKENPEYIKTGGFLYALQGSRTSHRAWWVNNRIKYMDSRFIAGSYANDYANMTIFTPTTWGGNIKPNADFEITANKYGYIHVSYGSKSKETKSQKVEPGKTYTFSASGLSLNDTETQVYGISSIKSLGNLADKYIGNPFDISRAVALQELILGNESPGYKNENLTELDLANNVMLSKLNIANLPNLKQAIDLSNCHQIEEIDARGSGVTSIILPKLGILKTLRLPKSTTSLALKNQSYLTTFHIEGKENLNTIVIENVEGIDGYQLVKDTINTADNNLIAIRLINVDIKDNNPTTLIKLSKLYGIDENGNITSQPEKAEITGIAKIDSATNNAIGILRKAFPKLKIEVTNPVDGIHFEDQAIQKIVIENWDKNKDGEVTLEEVQYESIPAGTFSNSNAIFFNEAYHWGGTGSIIDNVDTLEQLTIPMGKMEISNLPALKKLTLYAPNEILSDEPLFNYNIIKNCYSIEEFVLSGRYKETEKGGAILAKMVRPDASYFYKMLLPLRGYSTIIIDEESEIHRSSFALESTYPWGKDLETLIVSNLWKMDIPYFANLKTIKITGFADKLDTSIYMQHSQPLLENFIVDDTSGNSINKIDLRVPQIRNLQFRNMTCKGANGSVFALYGRDGVVPILSYIDLPSTYSPAGINLGRENVSGANKYGPFAVGAKFIIRSSKFIPALAINNGYGIFSDRVTIYVPDDLVDTYKNATNWNQLASIINPISSLG